MAFGVLIHRADSVYNDRPAERYQFPRPYLKTAEELVGSWIVYLEPKRVRNARGFFAVAKVSGVIPDPTEPEMFVAIIEAGSYLDFPIPVPFSDKGLPQERGLLNEKGLVSGRKQLSVRSLAPGDFHRIVSLGLPDADDLLPRVDAAKAAEAEGPADMLREVPLGYTAERPILQSLVNRPFRDRAFRHAVLSAYNRRCAITGWQLINGGGRPEAEAAHIKPVASGGPDSVRNGLALSGTVHWMFDRGLISLADDHSVMISRQVNNHEEIERIVNPTGRALVPEDDRLKPHPAFLAWHREEGPFKR